MRISHGDVLSFNVQGDRDTPKPMPEPMQTIITPSNVIQPLPKYPSPVWEDIDEIIDDFKNLLGYK